MQRIIVLLYLLIKSVRTATVHFQYSLVVSNEDKVVVSDISQVEKELHFEVAIPRAFWQSENSEACVRVSHDNGYVDSCYYIYNYTKRNIHVHGVTGPIRIDAKVENQGEANVGDARKMNLYLFDPNGNVQFDNDALFHPESGSLPLVYTGNLSTAVDIIPKRLSVSLLSTGTGDSVNAYRFERVGFDAERSEVYLIERNETNITADLPDVDIVTTTHRRHVQALNEGWNRSSAKEVPLWSINTGIRVKHVPEDFLNALYRDAKHAQDTGNYTVDDNGDEDSNNELPSIRLGGGHCIAVPTFIVSMPLPLFYWHTVAEGVFPLAYAIRRMQERLKVDNISPLIVLTQGWGDRLVPRFLAHMLEGMTAWPILDMDTLVEWQKRNGPLCFYDLTIGYYPQISNPSEFRHGTEWMLRRFGADLTSRDHEIAKSLHSSPVVTFVQRKDRCAASDLKWLKENHTISRGNGTGKNSAARSIVNLNDLTREAINMGSVVEVIYLEGMDVRDQMSAFRRADVIVAAHGSAWANTAFMRHDSAAIQVYGFGVKESCVSLMNMYRHTFEAMDDLCNGVLIDFPSVVPGYYREIREENASAHVAPFKFSDEFCTDDPMKGDNIAVKGKFTRNERSEDVEDSSCLVRFGDNLTACSQCENDIQSRALENPRWFWGEHFHRAYRWFKNAPFAVNVSVFRDELSKSLRLLSLDLDMKRKKKNQNKRRNQCITKGFRSGDGFDPPVLRDGYLGPQKDVAISCCNLSPEWVRQTWLRVMRDDDDDDVLCGHEIGTSNKIGSFEPMSLEHAKRVCDADEVCVAFAYTALGALFKSSRYPIVPFSELSMYKETGMQNSPATLYIKYDDENDKNPFSCSALGLSRPLQLAYVHYYLPHGGVETIIHTLTNSLSKGCFDITVVLVTDWMLEVQGGPMSAAIQAAGARIEIWPLLTSNPTEKEPGHMGLSYPVDLSILQELVPHFSKFDVIHSFYGGAYLSSVGMDAVSMTRLMSSERSPAPIHVNSIAAVIPLLRGHFYVDVVIMDSIPSYDYALQSLERFEDPPSTRIEMIEAGLDMSKFDPDSVKPWSYDDNDDNKPTVTIGFVGRLTQQKQPLLFVRAVAKLQKMKCHDDRYPGLRFVMVGSGTLTNQIVSLSKELNVSVLVFESTSEVPEVLASLDIFLHLSVWDTAAYGVREAMAMRLPIVALSSNVGVASYVENEVEGILLDQDDNIVEITSLALLRLACNDTLRDSMGRSGRMKMLNASSKGDFASRHADIYVNEWRTRNEKLIVG